MPEIPKIRGMQDPRLEVTNPLLPNPRMETQQTFSREQSRDRKTAIISGIIQGLKEMESTEGSERYKHGKKIYQVARLKAALYGIDPNKMETIARQAREEKDGTA